MRPDSVDGGLRDLGQQAEVALTDGGLETALIYHDGFDLPHFKAFPLLSCRTGP